MSRLFVSGVAAVAWLAVMSPAAASGETYDKLAYLTFSAPVQVPGVTLSAGTYRFHLTNPDTSRSVLQVLSNDGSFVYAMFNTTADGRTSLTRDPAVTFRETPTGVPPAIRSLFYGGEYQGYEFVYGKGEPNMFAEIVRQPEITYTYAPEPAAEIAVAVPEERRAEAPPAAEPIFEPAPAPEPEEIPQTATPVPIVAFGGVMTLIAGLGLGLLRRHAG